MTVQMLLSILHVLSCMALVVASLYWKRARAAENGAHRFLFPYLMTAGGLGLTWVMVPIVTLVMLWVRHGTFVFTSFRLSDPYAWAYRLVILLPLLPALGMFPSIGKRPLLLTVLAGLAMCPAAFLISQTICYNLFRNP